MDNIKEFNTADGNNKIHKIIIGVLIAIIVGFGVLFYMQQQKTKKIIADLNTATEEKVELTKDFEDLQQDFDYLETSNDSLSVQVEQQKEKIAQLITNLRKTKVQNRAEIQKYKKELKTLRNIMKGFIHQIDSLNTLNIELTAQNKQIRNKYESAQQKNKQLAEKYGEAADKVKKASVIKAINISVISYNHKGKTTYKAKKVKRFAVKFALDENVIAPTGTKKVYLRITNPDEHILIENNQPVFSYEGEEIAYSAVREIEYDGTVTNATVYFEYNEETPLMQGKYSVDIFCDGAMIGTSSVTLK